MIDELPEPALAQRIASLSTPQLMDAATKLAPFRDQASDQACTAVLDELERRVGGGPAFDLFVAQIYATTTIA